MTREMIPFNTVNSSSGNFRLAVVLALTYVHSSITNFMKDDNWISRRQKVKIMPLVMYLWSWECTHTCVHLHMKVILETRSKLGY